MGDFYSERDLKMLVDSHFFAIWNASQVACEILELLPETDIVEDLREILVTQLDLCMHIVEGKHYGSNNLEDFINFSDEVKSQALRMKESI